MHKNRRKHFLFLLVALAIVITIGYAFVTENLKINGGNSISSGSWIIYFDKIENESGVISPNTKISQDRQTIDFDISIKKPGDYYEFDVDTVNDGSIDAMIDSIQVEGLDNNYKKLMSFDVVYKDDHTTLHKCDLLPKKSRKTVTVKVKYTEDITEEDLLEESENINLKFKINYVQDGECNRNPLLTVNPNGGTYKGLRNVQDEEVEPNSTVRVEAPKYTGRNFKGYELEDGTLLEKESDGTTLIEVLEDDIVIKAIWDRKDYVARIVDNNTYYETLQDAINESLDGQTVELLRSTTENPENDKNITIDLGTNIVNGIFTNDRGYTLTLKNGTVKSDTIAFINNGTLNLGVKDGSYEEDNIILRGEQKGLEQNGTFNFYDGYIIGKLGLIGGHNDKEVDYFVYVENNTAKNYQKVYLTKNTTRAVVMTRYNGEVYYNNLQNAIDVTTLDSVNNQEENGYTMYVVRSFEAAYSVTLNNDDVVTLDLSGFDVETGYTVINNGNFTITDSVSTGSFIPSIPIENNNVLNIKDALLKSSTNANIIENNKTLTITNSTITSKGGYSVVNKGVGTVSIDKDTIINGDNYNFKNTSSTPLTFTEGTIYNLENSGTITLKENVLVSSLTQEYAIKNVGTINLEGGEVTGYNGINNANSLNVKSGTITTTNIGILNSGTLELTGGDIVSSRAGIENRGTLTAIKIDIAAPNGIINYGTATLSDDVNITSTSTCINSSGTTTVNGGSYIGSGNSVSCYGGTTTLNAGTFKSTATTTLVQHHGTINLNGGTVESPTNGAVVNYATFNMDGGTISSPIGVTGRGTYYEGNAYITINGGTINSTETGVLADKDRAYFNITGGTINATGSNGIGVKNSNSGDLSSTTITGGTINAGKYGVYNSHAPLTIGTNGEEILETPVIKGDLYGLYVDSGVVNFYDGLLKGITDGHYGEIEETPTNSAIYESTEVISSNTYKVHYLKIQDNWLKVGNQEFNSIDKATAVIDEAGTIEVINDANVTFTQTFPEGKSITFDLNGHDVKFAKNVVNNGTVEIVDSSDPKTGSLKTIYSGGIQNSGTLTLTEISLITNGTYGLNNTGVLNVNSLKVETTSDSTIYNVGGTVTVTNTDIETNNIAVNNAYNYPTAGTITVNNSNLTSTNGYAVEVNCGFVTLNDVEVEGHTYGAKVNRGTLTLDTGSIYGETAGVYGAGSYVQNGGETTSDTIGVSSTGTVTINGGKVEAPTAITMICDDKLTAVTHPVLITNGQVIGTENEAVKISKSLLKVTGGEVISLQSNAIYSDGYVEIGDNSNEIKNVPIIQGYEYAIYDKDINYYTKFFDGVLKGKTGTNNGLIDEIPDASMIQEGEETISGDLYQTKTITEFGNFLRVNGVEYNSFKKASAAIGAYESDEGEPLLNPSEGGTIEVIADAYVNFEAVLPEHKKITLDLRGHTLVMTQPLETKGINKIVDSSNSQNGLLRNIYTYAVESTGDLTIYGGTYKSEETYALGVLKGTTTLEGGNFNYKKGIYNTNNLIINNTNINLEDEDGIYNYEGTTTINGGTIHSKNKYAVNSFRSTLNVNGGDITSENNKAVRVVGFRFNMSDGYIYSINDEGITVTESTATISGGKIQSDTTSGIHIGSSTIASTTLNTTGGEFIGETYGIYLDGTNTDYNIDGGRAIGNTYGINVYAKDGTITSVYAEGTVNGINHTHGTLRMLGGTAVGKTQYGLYSSANLTLGTQDRNVDISNPLLIGELYGLYSTSNVDFYDGILKGKTYGYTGKFANIEVATQIWNDTETIDDVLYKTTYLIEERDIAENMRTHEKYNNLQTAFNSSEAGDTINLIANAPIYYPVTIENDVDITFDMNGYSISTNKKITNNGKVEVVNNSDKTSSIKTSSNIDLITTTNEMSFDNIKLTNTSTSRYVLTNSGTLTLNDSNISSVYGINNSNNLTLTNTNMSATSTTINSTGLLSINGGEYSGTTVVYSSTSGDVSIKNTKLLGTSTSLYNSSSNNSVEVDNVIMTGNLTTNGSTSTTTINALTLTGNYSNSSNTTMTSSSINSTLTASYSNQNLYFVTNSKKLDMDTVTLNLTTTNNANYYGVYLSGSATSEINNLTYNVSGVGNVYGVYLNDNNNDLVLTDGIVDVSGTNAYGIYINKGVVTLGISDSEKEKEDKVISTTNPLIKAVGTTKGLGVKKNDGLFKYYDGKLIGSTQAKPDTTTIVEEGYEASIYMDSSTGYEYCILENLEDGYTAVARMNGVYYNTIQEAINNSKTGSVITLLKNTIENVENTKNVVIDLNNHRITGKYFNRGTTRFINGSLYNASETTVQNTGTLILGEEGGEVSSVSVGIINENYTAINQLGRLIIYDGYVQGKVAINGEVTLTERGYAVKTEQTKEIDPDTEEEIVTYEKAYLINQSQMDDDEEKPTYSFMVTIDPNGGLYKGTSDIEENFLMQGETLEITDEPEREGYTFDHWEEVSETNAFENGVVTVTDSNVELRAIWNVTDQVVAKVGDNYYLTLNKAYNAAINGDRIELIKDVTENLTNDKTITLDLGGHKVTGTITNNGTLNLDNGRVENTTNTPIINNGTLNMGVDEGQMTTSSPIIFGGDYGIEQNGTFNFYDGSVYGQTAILGSYNKGAAGYYLYVDNDEDYHCQKVYLIKNSTQAVARVVNGGDYFFSTLKDAVKATDNLHPTVYLLVDNLEPPDPIVVAEGRKLIIDLDGHVLKFGPTITNNGNLSLIDSGNITKGKLILSSSITNDGTLTLDSIVISTTSNSANIINNNSSITIRKSTLTSQNGAVLNNTSAGSINLDNETVLTSSNYAINNSANGEVVITGGTIVGVQNTGSNLKLKNNTLSNASSKYVVNNTSGELTLEGTAVSATYRAINNDKATINIKSGNYSTSSNQVLYNVSGTVNITGGSFTSTTTSAILYTQYGELNISNASITSTTSAYPISNYYGVTTINSGTITSQKTYAVYYYDYNSKGSITINGGEIYSDTSNALYFESGIVNINGGTLTNNSTNSPAVYQGGGKLYITDGRITSNNQNAITSLSTISVTGGTIIGNNYGIYLNGNNSKLTFGTASDSVTKTSPQAVGGTYGLYVSKGTYEFYDGEFFGDTKGIYGSPADLPKGYIVKEASDTFTDPTTLISTVYNGAYLQEKDNFIQVGNKKFNDLQEAIDEIDGTGTMFLIGDSFVSEDSVIASGKNITFNLNNHNLELSKSIVNNGTLTIVDNSDDKNGTLENYVTDLVQNTGALTVENGTYKSNKNTFKSTGGTITFNNGTIINDNGDYGIYASNKATVLINYLEFSSNSTAYGIYGNDSSVTIEDAKFTNTSNKYVFSLNRGSLIIKGGTYSASRNDCLYTNSTLLDISGGSFTTNGSSAARIYYAPANSIISGGTFTSNSSNGIQVSNGTLEISGGTISGSYGIYDDGGNITVSDSTVIGKTYGIYLYSGTVTVGDSSNQVNTAVPSITGGSYGLYVRSGIANFYDGILKGKTAGYYGSISNVYPNYVITDGVDGEYKTNYLAVQPNFVRVGDQEFNSLQDAIDSIDSVGTMTLIANAQYFNTTSIPSNKTITFDLNNFTLETSSPIVNNGSLTIVDNSDDKNGMLENNASDLVQNTNTLVVNGGTFNTKNYTFKTTGGNVTFNGGTINNTGTSQAVYALNNATVLVNDINFTLTNTAIDIYSTDSSVTIEDGNFYSKSRYAVYTNRGNLTIKKGTFESNSYDTINTNSTLLDIRGGSYTSSSSAALRIYNMPANSKVTGGTYSSTSSYGIQTYSGTVEISDVVSTGKYGLYTEGTSLTLKKGTLTGSTYGLYVYSGAVSIGDSSNAVDTSKPSITGSSYGLYVRSGTVNFYDGILKGQTKGYYGSIAHVPDNTVVNEDTELIDEVTYQTAYLIEQKYVIKNTVTNEEYKNIQTAIDEAVTGEKLILIDNASAYYDIVIPDKEVIIETDGYSITTSKTITNNGDLTIKNTNTSKESEIINNANLVVIDNKNLLTVTNINFSHPEVSYYTINNSAAATLVVNGSDINAYYGIRNYNVANISNANITGYDGVYAEGVNSKTTLVNTNVTSNNRPLYIYRGEINVTGGTFTSPNSNHIYINTSSSVNNIISDATIVRGSNYGYDSIELYNNSKLKVVNTSITGGRINVSSGSSITLDGVTNDGRIENSGVLDASGCTFTYGNSYGQNISGIHNYSTGTMNISDSTINFTQLRDYSYEFYALRNIGTLNLNNTDISMSYTLNSVRTILYGIYNTGALTYKLGDIDISSSSVGYGIYNSTSTAVLSKLDIDISGGNNVYGIYNNSGSTTLKTGSISSYDAVNSYGVYVNGGVFTLGIYDGSGNAAADVSITDPEIRSVGTTKGTGVKIADGELHYYDGRIVGSHEAKPEAASDVELNFIAVAYTENDTNYPYYILESLTPNDGSIDYDWKVSVDDENSVYTKIITTDNLVWRDSLGNTYSEPAEGRYVEYNVRIQQNDLSDSFVYTVEATLGNEVSITVTQNNSTGLFVPANMNYVNDKITFTSGNISDYLNMNKTIILKVTSNSTILDSREYSYQGKEETFVAPKSGVYSLETWGAQGGWDGGYGGYSSGKIFLNKGDVLYVNVGGAGQGDGTHQTVAGGYNGGGDAIADEDGNTRQGSGGGATHIAKKSGLLSQLESYKGTLSSGEDYYVSDDIIIVAGGGGGRSNNAVLWSGLAGGNGGGYIGGDGESVVYYSYTFHGFGGTQTIGGVNSGDVSNHVEGTFGKGASGAVAGGGGGFFGGGNAYYSGGGGSGYIANPNLIDKHMVCYDCETSLNVSTKTISNENVSATPVTNYSKIGDGYARITYAESDLNRVYYSNGVSYENLYTSNTWQTETAQFLSDSIYLPTKTNGYYIVYTDTIDLSKYNTVIVRKTNFNDNRVGFLKYPSRVNNEEVKYVPTWTNISNTDIYLGDISNDTRNDLKFYISDWEGANSGYVYYISFSTKRTSEIQSDYSFVDR